MTATPMTIDDALALIRGQAGSRRDTGTGFERLVQRALSSHPGEYGTARFERIVPWSEWEGADGQPDTGIDLVGYQRNGKLAAIQCKCYAPDRTVKKADVAGFVAASNRPDVFDSRILVNTGAKLSPHATRLMSDAVPHVELILLEDMRRWPVADWAACFDSDGELRWDHEPYTPWPHQQRAVEDVLAGFSESDRGKLIMPCGTGKSVTSMWIAERQAGPGGTVLYLVPSIALMGQTMREWAANRSLPHAYLGVCSDTKAGRTDEDQTLAELTIPVTTDPERIAEVLDSGLSAGPNVMRVVFSTYQSLPVIAEAQADGNGAPFDLVVCDEAHRTTGAAKETAAALRAGRDGGFDGSVFQLVHDRQRVRAFKRLYMTATPKVYTDKAVAVAADRGFGMYSMGDEAVYGPEFHRLTFADAIADDLLADYEVVVVAADSSILRGNEPAGDSGHGIGRVSHDDAVKFAGIIDALADPETTGLTRPHRAAGTVNPLRSAKRVIAFNNTIAQSQAVSEHLPAVADRLFSQAPAETRAKELVDLQVRHIDGKSDALTRARSIQWLADGDTGDTGCLMLTNARCLTEGVDVPALDAVVMCSPRKSQIDVVQAVGRVMRRSENKQVGYVILPVVVPDGLSAADVLDRSAFKEVWSVLRALRSHDERLDIVVNTADMSDRRLPVSVLDVTAKGAAELERRTGLGEDPAFVQGQLDLDLRHAVASMVVEKVGDRQHWKRWGRRVAAITATVEAKIAAASASDGLADAWTKFRDDMAAAVGSVADDAQLAQMVAQHTVTMPVFEHLFAGADFTSRNPIAVALSGIADRFAQAGIRSDAELAPLDDFYKSVADRLDGAQSSENRLSVLLEVYESFFKAAMPDTVVQLGIAYTPVEIVDFMLRSADAVTRSLFGKGVTDRGVHVLDPFTGTGTYIHRLLAGKRTSGEWLIEPGDIDRKFSGEGDDTPPELHANEIVLLAYYLAAIKIEEGRAERIGRSDDGNENDDRGGYRAFQGIVFGDTFLNTDIGAAQRPLPGSVGMRRNNRRADRQNDQTITAIVGNPPWSAGKKKAGDAAKKDQYPEIADRIRDTYGKALKSVAGKSSSKAHGNLYVKAWRWASDRVLGNPDGGLVCFVHPNSLAGGVSLPGMRACMTQEFTDIWVIDLRGDANKAGDEFKLDGDQIFGPAAKVGVQITLAARSPDADPDQPANVRVARVPEYSSLEAKLEWLNAMGDVLEGADRFESITPNERHDWLDITDGSFERLPIPLCRPGSESGADAAVRRHALGVATNCDAFVYAFSREALARKMQAFIDEYNDTLELWLEYGAEPDDFDELTAATRPEIIKWTDRLKRTLKSKRRLEYDETRIRECLYRPFVKKWLYEDPLILSSVNTVSKMFPTPQHGAGESKPASGSAQIAGGGGDSRQQPIHADTLRNHRQSKPAGSQQPRRRRPSALPAAILVKTPGPAGTPDALMATNCLPDLKGLSASVPGSRAVPRRTQLR